MKEIPELIRKIDIVLHMFAGYTLSGDGIDYPEAFGMANLLFESDSPKIKAVEKNEFWKITEKLKKDGYVSNEMGNTYEATYEGIIMDYLGGYRQKYLDNHQQALLQSHRDLMAKRLTWINFWIAIATGIAALYYLIQICKSFSPSN